jgi:hypothetical protein
LAPACLLIRNLVSGQTIPNAVITAANADEKECFKVFCRANLIADINGHFVK